MSRCPVALRPAETRTGRRASRGAQKPGKRESEATIGTCSRLPGFPRGSILGEPTMISVCTALDRPSRQEDRGTSTGPRRADYTLAGTGFAAGPPPRWSPLRRGRTLRNSTDRKVPGRKARKREVTTRGSLVDNELHGVAGNSSIGIFRNPGSGLAVRQMSRRCRVTMDTNTIKRLLEFAVAKDASVVARTEAIRSRPAEKSSAIGTFTRFGDDPIYE